MYIYIYILYIFILYLHWSTCVFLLKTCQETVTGTDSVCQKIWNSHTMSGWFRQYVDKSDFPHGQHLSAAKHRFCSFSKPLSRYILHFREIVQCVNQAVATNGAPWAESWMKSMSETKYILLGMLTDLCQSCIELTRFFDNENLDIAAINQEIYFFDQQLEALIFFFACCFNIF